MRNAKKSRKVKKGGTTQRNMYNISKKHNKLVQKGGEISYEYWLGMANTEYYTLNDLKKLYQNVIKNNKEVGDINGDFMTLYDIEDYWNRDNLSTIMEFMGNPNVWSVIIPNIEIRGGESEKIEYKRASSRIEIPITNHPIAIYSGSHWRSRKANSDVWFDPYDEYQPNDTNQFCQTFAMMYLIENALPDKINDPFCFTKFYGYTKAALYFIRNIIYNFDFNYFREKYKSTPKYNYNKTQEKNIKLAINECIENPNICFNIIEMPKNGVLCKKK